MCLLLKFQFVGDVPNGVQAIEWSPGDEFLVLITTENKVILMASSFDTVYEVGLHEDGFGESKYLIIIWFHLLSNKLIIGLYHINKYISYHINTMI
jgi:hypothetical protein